MKNILILFAAVLLSFVSIGQNQVIFDKGQIGGMNFLNKDLGFISTYGFPNCLVKTINGGASWDTVFCRTQNHLSRVEFPSDSIGYVAVDDSLYKSIDGGQNWSFLYSRHRYFRNISCYDDDHCVSSGPDGEKITSDGGNTWQDLSATSGDSYTVKYFSSGVIYAISHYYSRPHFVSTDNGVSWGALSTSSSFIAHHVLNDSTIFAVDYSNNIMKSSDRGLTWSIVDVSASMQNGWGQVAAIKAYNEHYVVVACSSNTKLTVGCSLDGGLNWDFEEHPDTLSAGDAIEIPNLHTVYIRGHDWGNSTSAIKMDNTVDCFKSITSNNKINSIKSVSIYPNPSDGKFTVESQTALQSIRVLNQQGAFIKEIKLEGNSNAASIQIQDSGLYFIQVQSNNTIQTLKVSVIK
ncbi:MAG: photosystem II stability/assembly factor-like uncharacterized protein [Glaciecola sp.]|jgi:photosystem II stability/assembly factor-like uncharacterized protein